MATTRRLAILVSLAGAFWLAPAARLAAGGGGVTRTYYIAADEVVWDYAPSGANAAEGRAFNEAEKPWMEAGPHVAGRKVKKAIYREYTDATFTTRKPHPPEWEHLGFLGPLVRAEVGDTMPERAGPTTHEGSSAFWMYHSHNDEIRDVASGLIGPMIVTRKGMARPDGSPTDVDRELVAGFIEVDENHSWYVEENIQTYTTNPKGTLLTRSPFGDMIVMPAPPAPPAPGAAPLPPPPPPGLSDVEPPFGSWFKETINGYSYG